jgi:hypothetical protein
MFLNFYGLREQPFGVTPDNSHTYLAELASHTSYHELLKPLDLVPNLVPEAGLADRIEN